MAYYYYDRELANKLNTLSAFAGLGAAFRTLFPEDKMDLFTTMNMIYNILGKECIPPDLKNNKEIQAIIDEDRDVRNQYMTIAIIASCVFGRYDADNNRIFDNIKLLPSFNNGRKLYVEVDLPTTKFYIHKNKAGNYVLSFSNIRNQVYELAEFVISDREVTSVIIPKDYGMGEDAAHDCTTGDGYPDTGYNNLSPDEMWRQATIRYVVNLVRDMAENPEKYQEDEWI